MRRILICAGVAAASWLAPIGARTPLAQNVPAAASPDTTARVIVKFRAESSLLRKQALSAAGQQTLQAAGLGQRIGVALDSGRGLSERSHVVIGHGLTSKQLAARIAAQSDVEYAVADERKHIVAVPNDPLYAPTTAPARGPAVGQWYLKPPPPAGSASAAWGSTAPAAINAEQAWDVTQGNLSIVVAVLDTGVRFDHPDLQGGNVLPGYDMISADSGNVFTTANDGDGRDSDASDPGDFVSSAEATASCGRSSSSWHGTQTLSLIGGATHNGVGMASVSHGGVRVMPVRVLGKCGGYDSDIVAGIRWAAGLPVPGVPDNPTPARVINMSLGGDVACEQSYLDVIGQVNAAGVTVVASAGNSAGHAVSSPASCPGVIAVAAVRHIGTKVGFSDIGPQIAISAPGGNCINDTGACLYPIVAASNSGTTTPVSGPPGAIYTDSFNYSLGTSFSSPLVAGAVALMLSVQPTLTPEKVKAKLQSTARPFPTSGGTAGIPVCTTATGVDQLECYCTTSTCGAGMLDVAAAVQSVNGVQASIALTTTTPTANQAIALASNSALNAGQSIVSYVWTILNAGTSGATITGARDGAAVVVTPTAAGVFVIELATTDNKGFFSSTTLAVTVVGPPVPPASTPPAATPSGDGGGGALGVGWLLLLLGAVVSLALTAARAGPAGAGLSAAARDARRR